MSKQTAFTEYLNDSLNGETKEISYYLEMEKEQIIDAYIDSMDSLPVYADYNADAEEYYNETYKIKK